MTRMVGWVATHHVFNKEDMGRAATSTLWSSWGESYCIVPSKPHSQPQFLRLLSFKVLGAHQSQITLS